jgi:hypothetical protein
VACFCEHGNEASGSIRHGEFLDKLSDYFFKKFSLKVCDDDVLLK